MQAWAAALAVAFVAMPRAGHCYEPRVNYQLQCQGCHLADGSGQSDRVPSFRRTLVPLSGMPEGRVFVLTVPGVAQSPLSDAETAVLLNWMVRNLCDEPLPATFRDYTAEEVRKHRGHPLAQVAEVRGDLLSRLADGVDTVSRGASGTLPR